MSNDSDTPFESAELRDLSACREYLSMNTATLGYRLPITQTVDAIARAGFGALAPWRQEVEKPEVNVSALARQIRDAGLAVSGYVRTAYFSGDTPQTRQAAIEDNRKALHIAAELGASCYVAVVGGLSADLSDVKGSRQVIIDGLLALGETAKQVGVPIALEPLHPMYAADRALLNTLAQAKAWLTVLQAEYPQQFGVVVDAYHVWWDPQLEQGISDLAGDIMGFHVCDWLVPTQDMLMDRGMMGDGVIQLPPLRRMVEATGYQQFVEVEIFSAQHWWQRPVDEVLQTAMERLLRVC